MSKLVYVTLLAASVLLATVNGFEVQGPCPDDENGRPHQPGDTWQVGCYSCDCWGGGYGCLQMLSFATCSYPEGCVKVYNDDGCELMAVMENQTDVVCDAISCYVLGK